MKKKLLSLFLICTTAISLLGTSTFAAPSLSASVSKSEVNVGDSVTVTFTVKGDKVVGSVDAIVQYDDERLEYTSAKGSLGNFGENAQGQTIKLSDYNVNSTSSTYTLSLTFKAKAVGEATVSLRGLDCAYTDEEPFSAPDKSVKISVKSKNTSLSSNCDLKDLQPPAGCKLSPAFSSNITEYTCTVPYSVKSFPLEPVRADSTSKVSYFGSVSLNVGENTRGVKVTAQDGTVKTYTVKITRLEDSTATAEPTPTATATPEPTENRLTATIDGKILTVMDKILSELPQGFEKSARYYDGEEVEVGVLGDVCIYELTDGETSSFYIISYGVIEKYISVKVTGTEYTVLSKNDRDMSRFTEKQVVLPSGDTVKGWETDGLGEGYYAVPVMNNVTGETYMAVYCAEDGTMQKMSEKLLEALSACGPVPEPDNGIKEYKTLLMVIVVVIGCLIVALVIVLVKRNKKSPQRTWNFDGESDPYGINESVQGLDGTEDTDGTENSCFREEEIYLGDESDFE